MDTDLKKEKTKEAVCTSLKQGMFKKDAAVMAGISEATFYRWIDEDKSFESGVEASILEYKRSLITNVNVSAEKDGRLALEVLRRRFPDEWGVPQTFKCKHEESEPRTMADELRKLLVDRMLESNFEEASPETKRMWEVNLRGI